MSNVINKFNINFTFQSRSVDPFDIFLRKYDRFQNKITLSIVLRNNIPYALLLYIIRNLTIQCYIQYFKESPTKNYFLKGKVLVWFSLYRKMSYTET